MTGVRTGACAIGPGLPRADIETACGRCGRPLIALA